LHQCASHASGSNPIYQKELQNKSISLKKSDLKELKNMTIVYPKGALTELLLKYKQKS